MSFQFSKSVEGESRTKELVNVLREDALLLRAPLILVGALLPHRRALVEMTLRGHRLAVPLPGVPMSPHAWRTPHSFLSPPCWSAWRPLVPSCTDSLCISLSCGLGYGLRCMVVNLSKRDKRENFLNKYKVFHESCNLIIS